VLHARNGQSLPNWLAFAFDPDPEQLPSLLVRALRLHDGQSNGFIARVPAVVTNSTHVTAKDMRARLEFETCAVPGLESHEPRQANDPHFQVSMLYPCACWRRPTWMYGDTASQIE